MMVRVLVIMIVVRRRIGQAGLLLGSMKGGGGGCGAIGAICAVIGTGGGTSNCNDTSAR